jgi:hypothetical protein
MTPLDRYIESMGPKELSEAFRALAHLAIVQRLSGVAEAARRLPMGAAQTALMGVHQEQATQQEASSYAGLD